ncbi:hypothetical protein FWF74_00835 [Candidatus Saccharibacteria bacterium]|nr:hypothetical protein [Candidatus Saccharibacteria bacterium]MCL1963280.1 hypothetical protein [Candidatus Saccharibacteria bacterium]
MVVSGCIVIAIAAGATVLILSGILTEEAIRRSSLDGQVAKLQANIEKAKKDNNLDNYLTVQNQLININESKKGQLVYTRLLNYLKQANPAGDFGVRLSSVDVDESGTVSVSGDTGSVASLGVYENTLKTAKITYYVDVDGEVTKKTEMLFVSVSEPEFSMSSATDGPPKETFTITLTFNPIVFNSNIKGDKDGSPDIVPVITTPSDKPIDPNQPLFKERAE